MRIRTRTIRALGGLLAGAVLAGVVGVVGVAGVARACGLDGVPSLSVNGRLVAINSPLTNSAQFATWTPFVARGAYPTNHALLFQENRANIAKTLPPVAFKYPWRWHFGDGTTATGTSVSHIYRRPGSYIVSVEAYFVAGKQRQWFTFDKATVHVR